MHKNVSPQFYIKHLQTGLDLRIIENYSPRVNILLNKINGQ